MAKTSFNMTPAIAQALCVLRNEKGMTRAQVAAEIGTTEPSIARYENGQRTPSANTIAALSAVFEVSTDRFFPSQDDIKTALKLMKGKDADSDKNKNK